MTREPASPPPGQGGGFHKVLAMALVLAGVGFVLWRWTGGPPRQDADAASRATAGADMPQSADTDPTHATDGMRAAAATLPRAVQTRDLSEVIVLAPGQPEPGMGEVIQRLHQAGIHEGLGAFNPPGTRPPLVGIAVPPDFPLPEGYVRHHQTTDDGQDIEAILMFSPDYRFFDQAGQPIRVPDDRVVPPSMAPPGLPVREVRIPPPIKPAGGMP